ncbi:MAG: hypothetical protein ACREGB_00160 [Candidatus Saccharimonadales bacterium]
MSEQKQDLEELSLEGGKYKFQYVDNALACLRYGQPWREFVGDKAVFSLFYQALELQKQAAVRETALFEAINERDKLAKENGVMSDVPSWEYWRDRAEQAESFIATKFTMLRGLINKVNVVTSEWRHTGYIGKIYKNSVSDLYDRQIEAERVEFAPHPGELMLNVVRAAERLQLGFDVGIPTLSEEVADFSAAVRAYQGKK